jgi:hypothetical protein
MIIKKYKQLNEAIETDFKVGDIILYEGEIGKVLRVDLPQYQLLKVRLYHPTLNTTVTTVSSTLCEKFNEE